MHLRWILKSPWNQGPRSLLSHTWRLGLGLLRMQSLWASDVEVTVSDCFGCCLWNYSKAPISRKQREVTNSYNRKIQHSPTRCKQSCLVSIHELPEWNVNDSKIQTIWGSIQNLRKASRSGTAECTSPGTDYNWVKNWPHYSYLLYKMKCHFSQPRKCKL